MTLFLPFFDLLTSGVADFVYCSFCTIWTLLWLSAPAAKFVVEWNVSTKVFTATNFRWCYYFNFEMTIKNYFLKNLSTIILVWRHCGIFMEIMLRPLCSVQEHFWGWIRWSMIKRTLYFVYWKSTNSWNITKIKK